VGGDRTVHVDDGAHDVEHQGRDGRQIALHR